MATITNTHRSVIADARGARFNGGKLRLYKAGAELVLEVSLGATAFDAAVNGVAALAGVPLEAQAVAAAEEVDTLTAALRTSGGVDEIAGMTVTATGGGGMVTLDNVDIAVGQTVRITAFTITDPASF